MQGAEVSSLVQQTELTLKLRSSPTMLAGSFLCTSPMWGHKAPPQHHPFDNRDSGMPVVDQECPCLLSAWREDAQASLTPCPGCS